MPKKKESLTIKELSDKLAWRAFGEQGAWNNELQFIMMNRGNTNDSVNEVLEDILRNV